MAPNEQLVSCVIAYTLTTGVDAYLCVPSVSCTSPATCPSCAPTTTSTTTTQPSTTTTTTSSSSTSTTSTTSSTSTSTTTSSTSTTSTTTTLNPNCQCYKFSNPAGNSEFIYKPCGSNDTVAYLFYVEGTTEVYFCIDTTYAPILGTGVIAESCETGCNSSTVCQGCQPTYYYYIAQHCGNPLISDTFVSTVSGIVGDSFFYNGVCWFITDTTLPATAIAMPFTIYDTCVDCQAANP